MSEKFYTNVAVIGNTILYRGLKNGERIKEKVDFKPTLFLPSNKPTKYKTLDGQYCDKIKFADIKEARDFVKQYTEVDGFKFFGNTRWVYVHLSDAFPNPIQFDQTKIVVANIDIETAKENGYGTPENPSEEITAITVKAHGRFYVFGCGVYENNREDVKYIKSRSEADMLNRFLEFWEGLAPDVVTGWNCVPLDSKIWTKSGLVEIGKLSLGSELYNNQKLETIFPISKKKLWNIKLANNHIIRSSGEHKFYTLTKVSKYQNISQMKLSGIWKETKDITHKSYLMIPKNTLLRDSVGADDLDLYYTLGMIFTDGTKSGKNISVYNTKLEILERVAGFNNKHKISPHKSISGISLPNRPTKRVRIYLREDHILSKYIGLIYVGDVKRLDVENLSKLSKVQFNAFLSGLIDGDGSVCPHGDVSYCNFNNQISNLNSLLLWNNIVCSGIGDNKLRISRRCDINLNLSHPIKKERLKNRNLGMNYAEQSHPNLNSKIIETEDSWYFRIDLVEETNSFVDMIDIETTTHEFVLDGVRTHNCQFYDIPYMVNRISRVLSDKDSRRMSPWGFLSTRNANYKGKMHPVVELVGISTLDYIELYRKFQPKQESEKLNYVAYVELGEKKLDYSEYGDLHDLYKKNYQKFIDYNIKDVDLVDKLEQKLKLIDMSITLAFDAKVNFVDVFAQVRMWDAITFDALRKKNIVVPQVQESRKDEQYAGGYVKEIRPGMYDWVLSFDLNSLYPMLIGQFNISPEMLVPDKFIPGTFRKNSDSTYDISKMLNKQIDLSPLKECNIGMAANGHCFSNERQGFIPEILMRMYEDRKVYKQKMIEAQKQLELVKQELHRRGL